MMTVTEDKVTARDLGQVVMVSSTHLIKRRMYFLLKILLGKRKGVNVKFVSWILKLNEGKETVYSN